MYSRANKILVLFALVLIMGFEVGVSQIEIYFVKQVKDKTYVASANGIELLENRNSHLLIETKNDKITTLYSHANTLGAGTYNGMVYLLSDSLKKTIELPVQDNGSPYLVNGITYSRQCWWVSTLEGLVFKISSNGNYTELPFIDTRTGKLKNILSIASDNDQHLWISTIDRIYFLTDIHTGRHKTMEFLASSTYHTPATRMVESDLGVFIFYEESNNQHLSLGTLSPGLMDGIKKEINLPDEFLKKQPLAITYSNNSLWLLGNDKLYELKNYKWISHTYHADDFGKVHDIEIIEGKLYVSGSRGLFQVGFF